MADGLEADVVTMNQANDIEFLADKGLVAKDWARKFPNSASPYTSTMVFIVRKGNPKGFKDWSDLARRHAGCAGHRPASEEHRQRPQHLPVGLKPQASATFW